MGRRFEKARLQPCRTSPENFFGGCVAPQLHRVPQIERTSTAQKDFQPVGHTLFSPRSKTVGSGTKKNSSSSGAQHRDFNRVTPVITNFVDLEVSGG
jgi:hypothetical protein